MSCSLGPVPASGSGSLRTYDAYEAAERAGWDVAFEDLDADIGSGLMREQGVVLINEALPEPVRHDWLAHQLMHTDWPGGYGEAPRLLEQSVREATAQRLIPAPMLMIAVTRALSADGPDTAAVAAQLLGTHVDTLRDRVFTLTPEEMRSGLGAVLTALTWPPRTVRRHRCVQDTEPMPPVSWRSRLLRGLVHRG